MFIMKKQKEIYYDFKNIKPFEEILQKQKQHDEFLTNTKSLFDIFGKLGISNFMY